MTIFGAGHQVVTGITLPAAPIDGQIVYETDTKKIMNWNGSSWVEVMKSGLTPASGDLTGTYPNPTITNITNAPIHNSNTTLSFRTSNVERIGVDASGRITRPYQPGFFVYNATNLGRGAGDQSAMVWSNVVYNTGSHYNTSNGRFTAPVSGYYMFCASIRLDGGGSGSYMRWGIKKNNTGNGWDSQYGQQHAIFGGTHPTDYITLPVSTVIYLAASDYVWSWAFHVATGTTCIAAESSFSGYFLG